MSKHNKFIKISYVCRLDFVIDYYIRPWNSFVIKKNEFIFIKLIEVQQQNQYQAVFHVDDKLIKDSDNIDIVYWKLSRCFYMMYTFSLPRQNAAIWLAVEV